jgi:ATP-grasp domain-containing protein
VSDSFGQSVLLASSIRWPLTAKLALALLRHGCKVEVVCPPDHPFSFVSGINKMYPYRGIDSLGSLYEAITTAKPGLVIPCDDGVVWQLHELYKSKPELRPLIERSLGSASGFAIVAGRAELMDLARELNIRAPLTKRISSLADLRQWFSGPGDSGVMKMDWTCGGKGVRMVDSLADAEQSMKYMKQPATVGTALGRWLLIHDSLALWKWKNQGRPVLTLQQFIPGRPANTMLVCREGKVLAMVTVEVLYAQSTTGTALAVRVVDNEEIRTAAERIAARLQLSGFHGLDFVLEEGTDRAYLIELNPRCTQLGHLRIKGQGDLAGVLCEAFGHVDARRNERYIQEDVIAFFPEALFSNPKCPYLGSAFVDVPWEEPKLVVELMRGDWRDRRLLARIYRALRPPRKTAVAFDTTPATRATENRPLAEPSLRH